MKPSCFVRPKLRNKPNTCLRVSYSALAHIANCHVFRWWLQDTTKLWLYWKALWYHNDTEHTCTFTYLIPVQTHPSENINTFGTWFYGLRALGLTSRLYFQTQRSTYQPLQYKDPVVKQNNTFTYVHVLLRLKDTLHRSVNDDHQRYRSKKTKRTRYSFVLVVNITSMGRRSNIVIFRRHKDEKGLNKSNYFCIPEGLFYWTAYEFMWHIEAASCGRCDQEQHHEDSCALLGTDRCWRRFRRIGGDCMLSRYWLCQINENTAGALPFSSSLWDQRKSFVLNSKKKSPGLEWHETKCCSVHPNCPASVRTNRATRTSFGSDFSFLLWVNAPCLR